jgi:phosphoenolpyruvate carboxykinase (ATP)
MAGCWLVNTGWSGGPYGVGQRMKISFTRAMIKAILNGRLALIDTKPDPIFGLNIPETCPDVPTQVLQPRNTWSDPEAYDKQAHDLARRFNENFKRYAAGVSEAVRAVAPKGQ